MGKKIPKKIKKGMFCADIMLPLCRFKAKNLADTRLLFDVETTSKRRNGANLTSFQRDVEFHLGKASSSNFTKVILFTQSVMYKSTDALLIWKIFVAV